MDSSFGALMDDAVAADAARMSGRVFADARGVGVARRVRTRRTVRAAGIGGGTMLTAGALVLGATHMRWGSGSMAPAGVWPGGCTPTAVADVGSIWTVPAVPRAHVIDVSPDHDLET